MKISKQLGMAALTLMLTGGLLAACGGSGTSTSGSDASAGGEASAVTVEEGVLKMATNAAFPPYEYVEGSEYKGIDVEIADKLADKLGLTLEVNDVDFNAIIGGVETGKYDMGMAGMTVTDERKQSVNFTDSYATGIQAIIVQEGSAIASADDLSEETRIGVQEGTTGDIYASDDYGDDAVTRYKTGADAVQALLTGKIDCVIIDNEPAKSFVEVNEGLVVLDTSYVEEDYAICIAKENEELLTKLDEALKELKDDGTIDEIVEKYIPSDGSASAQ